MMSDSEFRDERVSFDEIAAALKGLNYEVRALREPYNGWRVVYVESVARQIVEWVHDHREPEYIPGEIYQDATGRKLMRRDDDLWPWFVLTYAPGDQIAFSIPGGEHRYFGENFPVRPLRKLVPEPE